MTNNWSLVPISEVAERIERPEVPKPGVTYRQLGVRLWGVGAYEREAIDGIETRYKTLSRVEAGDIVVNKIWARNGSVAVAPSRLAGCYVSTEFPQFAPDPDQIEPRWFHWLTKTKGFWRQCDEKSHGTSGKNRIRPEKFLEIKIPLPSLNEQRRIVARIEELAAKVEQAQLLRQQSVVEVEALINSQARQILSGIGEEITQLSCWLDPNREGVQTGPFGAQLGTDDFVESGHPVLTIGNVQYEGIRLDGLKYVMDEKA
jgi:type I restriction enzyme S subunit